jgi:MoxR-like ATPase
MGNMTKLRKYHSEAAKLHEIIKPGVTYRVKDLATESGMPFSTVHYVVRKTLEQNKPGSPLWSLPVVEAAPEAKMNLASSVTSIKSAEVYIPAVEKEYVRWGSSKDIEAIMKSRMFYPVYISGPSGNGKTMMVEQSAAKAKVPFLRVQITPETDEDDLIGGFRLINGETVFCKGPVIKAMEEGALLLIDEIDRGTNKIMCLQGVLEGKPVLIKKTGETVSPAEGFNVIATANTKGRGSDDGRFSAATIIDDAFLERFVSAINQPWPSKAIEKKIVGNHMDKFDSVDTDFLDKLITWASIIRKTFEVDGVDEVISTRRLCHIIKTFSIFDDRAKSIEMCINRFDEDTITAFSDLYSKIDAGELTDEESNEVDLTSASEKSVEGYDVP